MASVRREEGFTLVELVIAMAMFTVVLGATAQSLISYYAALDLQNQRHTALRNCTAVISQMREVRDTSTDDFPDAILDEWPNAGVVAGVGALPQEQVTVTYADPNANPLRVTVQSSWVDLRGRPVAIQVSTMLTSQ
ncbi:MAG TPA: type II secretion system protein [Candidatus Hydrogenedentes bacterium]|nr:type II secretion system protein [Candidatus Hydrogenedentota bacterium]HRK33095.1 type II secretion system protein [Candidatus Hydrogenedentota bacterium]